MIKQKGLPTSRTLEKFVDKRLTKGELRSDNSKKHFTFGRIQEMKKILRRCEVVSKKTLIECLEYLTIFADAQWRYTHKVKQDMEYYRNEMLHARAVAMLYANKYGAIYHHPIYKHWKAVNNLFVADGGLEYKGSLVPTQLVDNYNKSIQRGKSNPLVGELWLTKKTGDEVEIVEIHKNKVYTVRHISTGDFYMVEMKHLKRRLMQDENRPTLYKDGAVK